MVLTLHMTDGSEKTAPVYRETLDDGVTALFARAAAPAPLSADCGAVMHLEELPEIEAATAIFRHCEYWTRPCFCDDWRTVPDETQLLLARTGDGSYLAVVPLVSEDYKCVLRGAARGLEARLFSWCEGLTSCTAPAVVLARGDEPLSLVRRAVRWGLRLLGHEDYAIEHRRFPAQLEYLGWCTWDAMQIRVNQTDILAKCREFQEKDIPVRWMMLDDMWAEIHQFYGAAYDGFDEMLTLMRRGELYDFDADPQRFPEGLRGLIRRVGEQGLAVGVWHPVTGYWHGIDPAGPLARRFADDLMRAGGDMLVVKPDYAHASHFFSAWHAYLKDCGAAFLKVDNQSAYRRYYRGCGTVGQCASQMQRAIDDSALRFFDNTLVNCMGLASECVWNRPTSPVNRCSDDFQPDNRPWFTKHILQCAFNSLLQGQFCCCDWDMWWTGDSQGLKNSLLRAVSGGPVYISDRLGESVASLLRPLVWSDGRLLRCERPALPSADSLFGDPTVSGRVFKVQNICRDAGVVAVFDVDGDDRPVSGFVGADDVPGLAGEEFLLYEHFSRRHWLLRRGERLPVALDGGDDFRLYLIIPLHQGAAPVGRVDKFLSPAAVTGWDGAHMTLREDGPCAWYAAGQLHFAERRPEEKEI